MSTRMITILKPTKWKLTMEMILPFMEPSNMATACGLDGYTMGTSQRFSKKPLIQVSAGSP
jgi:hypothetical protein